MQNVFCCQVKFIGEDGDDEGGLKREFWLLFSREVKSRFFEGKDGHSTLKHDSSSLIVSFQ